MPNMTLAVPPELKREMERHPEINWSEVARSAFREKMSDLEFLREFKSRSDLTEAEALALGRRVNQGLRERYRSSDLGQTGVSSDS